MNPKSITGPGAGAGRDALTRVTSYISEHAMEHISLRQAAAATFLSQGYLTRLLKKELGRSFVELVTDRRLERARELLAHTRLRIGEIARLCGFEDEAYFTRRFRQWFGQSPSQWRDAMRARLRAA